MNNSLLRRVLAIQSFLVGCGILIFLLFFSHTGDSGIETLKAIGVILGLAIYVALSLHVVQLLRSPDAGNRTSAIATLLCLPSIAGLAFYILAQRIA